MFKIEDFDVGKFDSILARGLCYGMGHQGSQVCIEAAICECLGLAHSDDPKCVATSVRRFKIKLNDSCWSSPEARAKGLRDLGIAQLGSLGVVNDVEFTTCLAKKTIQVLIPKFFRSLYPENEKLMALVAICEAEGTRRSILDFNIAASDAAAYTAAAASDAAAYTAAAASDAAAYAADAAAAASDAAAYAAAASDAAAYAAAASDAAAYTAAAASKATVYADAAAYDDAAAYAADASAAASDTAAAYADAASNAAAASAAYAAAYAAAAAASDASSYLSLSASLALEVLRELDSPGVALLES